MSPELEDTLREILSDGERGLAHQCHVLLLMQMLADGDPLPTLSDLLEEMVRDATWQWHCDRDHTSHNNGIDNNNRSHGLDAILEAQAHANPDLKKLSLHAGEDAGSKRNIDAPGDQPPAQMTPDQRVVPASLFFPLLEVHTVPSVWLYLNRFTSSNAETLS